MFRVIPTAGMTLNDRHALTQRLRDIAEKELSVPYKKEGVQLPSSL